ncbi:hypothetical protein FRC02_000910 [Tulasnella sp. 418]|nr:hypothetical protein FRC02_000910 [Tulasnella sp. 418]
MQEWAQQQEKAMLDRKILEWRSGFNSHGADAVSAKGPLVGQNEACSDTDLDSIHGEVGDDDKS